VAGRPIEPDAAFNIASMTKPITSVAAMMLVNEGKLSLDVPASRYLPKLKGRAVLVSVDSAHGTIVTRPANREVTVWALLRHIRDCVLVLDATGGAEAAGRITPVAAGKVASRR